MQQSAGLTSTEAFQGFPLIDFKACPGATPEGVPPMTLFNRRPPARRSLPVRAELRQIRKLDIQMRKFERLRAIAAADDLPEGNEYKEAASRFIKELRSPETAGLEKSFLEWTEKFVAAARTLANIHGLPLEKEIGHGRLITLAHQAKMTRGDSYISDVSRSLRVNLPATGRYQSLTAEASVLPAEDETASDYQAATTRLQRLEKVRVAFVDNYRQLRALLREANPDVCNLTARLEMFFVMMNNLEKDAAETIGAQPVA